MCKYLSSSGQVPKYEFSRAIFFCLFFVLFFIQYTDSVAYIYISTQSYIHSKNLKKSWNKKTFKPHNFSIYVSCFSTLGFSSYKILPVLQFPQNTRHKEYAFFSYLHRHFIYIFIYVFIHTILSSENELLIWHRGMSAGLCHVQVRFMVVENQNKRSNSKNNLN